MKTAPRSFPIIRTGNGETIILGDELGRGGEGTVFSVSNKSGFAAKIYHGAIGREKTDKIAAMLAIKNESLLRLTAWPSDLILKNQNEPCGFIMSKIDGCKDIHTLYSPKSRKLEFNKADWRFLVRTATNVAKAFAIIHESGCVIGDVNHASVTVSPQATVKLIDCDSFQITANGRLFSCDVGNPTFTPPELQGISLAGTTRTANHDSFGLAILIFHLLFMGRHPFAGRYSGNDDMPIEKAIKEFRFAYSSNQSSTRMQSPPYTLALTSVSPQLAVLFEQAFGNNGVRNGGRPSAKQWATALEELEKNLKVCPQVSSHYYLNTSSSCPWCPIEAATSVSLFSTIFHVGGQSSIDMASLWAKINSIKPPSLPPKLMEKSDFGTIKASSEALAIKEKTSTYNSIMTLVVMLAVIAGIAAAPHLWVVSAFIGFIFYKALHKNVDEKAATQIRSSYNDAKNRWENLQQQWKLNTDDQPFKKKFGSLASLHQEWIDLPNLRLRKLKQLEDNRREQQLQRFLERFYIEKADISGIGSGRKTMLQSYNIETAWDVTTSNVMRVPGFGNAMTSKLTAWRKNIEKSFVFSPALGVDPRDTSAVEQEMLSTKRKLEIKLATETEELNRFVLQTESQRQILKRNLDQALEAFLRAEVNLKAVS